MKLPAWLKENCPSIERAPLGELTWVGIGGPAALLLEPRNRDELLKSLRGLLREKIPFRILGGGTNILVHDHGIPEVVVSTRGLSHCYKIDGQPLSFRLEAGVSLARWVSLCHRQSLQGAECLVGIPGTVGGAAVMNAGGRHGAMGSLIRRATVINGEGEVEEVSLSPDDFGYRHSPLKGRLVAAVEVAMERGEKDAIWDRMTAILKAKRSSQPMNEKSCGCVFKNPPGLSAGELLEGAGLKGVARGDARFSEQHANFIVNSGESTFRDYFELIELGRSRVMAKHDVRLELEIDIWSREENSLSW